MARPTRFAAFAAACALASGLAAADEPIGSSMSLPVPDAERGKTLFANKGCVICHSVNGIGGTAAPPLDASEPAGAFDPLDFAARMWRGAVAMTMLQGSEFGYTIELTGKDIADLAAFAENHVVQQSFSEADIPDLMKGWTLDENYIQDLDQREGKAE